MPSSVIATGMLPRSASSRTSDMESESITPCPARMTGRLAPLISRAASSYSFDDGLRSGR